MEVLLAFVFGSVAMFFLGLFAWIFVAKKEADDGFSWISAFVSLIGFIAMLAFGIVWGVTYMTSYNDIQRLSAFQNETMSAYKHAIDRTESVVIDASRTRGDSFTDFSYQQQGQSVSERVKELRDTVAQYNRDLYALEGKNKIPIIGAMYRDVPEDLKPIKLGSLP